MTSPTEEETLINLINQGDPVWRSPMTQIEKIRRSRYAIYSMVFDRFILLDLFDPWTTFITSKILSSKLSTTTLCIRKFVSLFNNGDCPLLYTINDEEKAKVLKTVNKMQTPIMMQIAISSESIEYAGAPIDYTTLEQKQMLANVHNYAQFCHRVIYAGRLADARMNSDDHYFYSQVMGSDIQDKLYIKGDQTQVEGGILWSIYRILYLSITIEEAMDKISNLWIETKGLDPGFKKIFYFYLDLGTA